MYIPLNPNPYLLHQPWVPPGMELTEILWIGAQVGVPGNVEVWVAFCTLFVLASLVEYVFVHVLLCTVPAQLKHVCCKSAVNKQARPPSSSCHFSATDVSIITVCFYYSVQITLFRRRTRTAYLWMSTVV